MSNRFQELFQRVERLGIKRQRLRELTGLDESTLSRAFNGHTDPLTSTIDKIRRAVELEERDMAEYLAKIGKGPAA